MKKITVLLMALAMSVSLVACGNNTTDPDNKENPSQSQTESTESGEKNTENPSEGAGTLPDDELTLQKLSSDTYSPILKKFTGIQISNDDGVRSKKARSVNRVNELEIELKCEGIEPVELLRRVFNQCLELSPDGVWLKATDPETYKVGKGENFKDYDSFIATQQVYTNTVLATWFYEYDGKLYLINCGAAFDEFSMDMRWSVL